MAEASQSGEPVAQIARRYDLDERRVSNWMKKGANGRGIVRRQDCNTSRLIRTCDRVRGHVRLTARQARAYIDTLDVLPVGTPASSDEDEQAQAILG